MRLALEHVSARQLFVLVLLLQNGSQLFRRPWATGIENLFIIMAGALLSQLLLVLLWWLLAKDGGNTGLFPWVVRKCGRKISFAVFAVLAIYFVFTAFSDVIYMADSVKIWVLSSTPSWIVLFLLLVLSAHAASASFGAAINVIKVSLLPFAIGLLMIVIMIVSDWDMEKLLPVWDRYNDHRSFAEGIIRSFSAFASYEVLLYAFPLLDKKKSKAGLVAVSLGNGVSAIMYAAVSVVSSLLYTSAQMDGVPVPILFALKQLETNVIQSFDVFFSCLWIFVSIARVILCLFAAAKALDHLLGNSRNKHGYWAWGAAACCFAVGCFIPNHYTIISILDYRTFLSLAFLAAAVLFVWMLSRFKREQGGP
ncbi:GerAB/ArcD/ProY family transporter [Paenibacillus sp. LHD-117]|uniref:GerAB/ArcD/ProY family transporter n=1 Tax=Paenibacillus sp. LHD-117 TaxID=3071412 RepID=UPI0027E1B101|nr:GerAB/ArcD/ProY family transporter [Paenibacillus sp. LHD-117]MDQ6420635.1 GerAB/ArcD/ProY family transporter [Paenibacillus sp. LHD-117]